MIWSDTFSVKVAAERVVKKPPEPTDRKKGMIQEMGTVDSVSLMVLHLL